MSYSIYRASLYYEPMPTSESDLKLMRRNDEQHTELPFLGSRQLQVQVGQQGLGRLHVRTLMRKMGIEAIYRRKKTPPSAIPCMLSTPTCFAAFSSIGRTRCGPPTSPTSRWPVASYICSR
jgi:hypothetical protein